MSQLSLLDIKQILGNLPKKERSLIDRFFQISSCTSKLLVPNTFEDKVMEYFGTKGKHSDFLESKEEIIRRISNQQILRIFNKVSFEGAIFNSARALRPGMKTHQNAQYRKRVATYIKSKIKQCDFCFPEKYTAKDIFGRIKGKHCISCSNIAKYDKYSGIIVGNKHNPLNFTQEELSDYINTSFKWFKTVAEYDADYQVPFLIWNCLEGAGASITHTHLQVLASNNYYGKVGTIFQIAKNYSEKYNSDYFQDLYHVYSYLGLADQYKDVKIMAPLTPVKGREIIILSNSCGRNFQSTLYKVLRTLIDRLYGLCFNLSISIPKSNEKSTLPYITKIVERNRLFKSTSDIATMELYGNSIITVDPYQTIKYLKNYPD